MRTYNNLTMDKWNKLSMKDKAKYIKLAVDSGITNLNVIRDTYNKFDEGGYKEDRTDHPIESILNIDRDIQLADYINRINHTDYNTNTYSPFYQASDNTYGIVPLPEVQITAPMTKRARNNIEARRGMHYMQQGLEDAAKVAAPIVAGAALPAIASTGALGTITDLASIATNPTDPLNYLPYAKKAASLGKKFKNVIVPKIPTLDLNSDEINVILNDNLKFLDAMDIKGFEFDVPEYSSLETERFEFITKPYHKVIIPSKNSNALNYLDWLDRTFNLKTKRHAYVFGRNSFEDGIGGLYYPSFKRVDLNSAYANDFDSVFIHEAGSHATDDKVLNMEVKDYPFKLPKATVKRGGKYPTVSEIYLDIVNIKPDDLAILKYKIENAKNLKNYGVFSNSGSNNWYEGRATLNEARYRLFFPEFEKSPIAAIDDTTDDEIIEMIADMNLYGEDYKKAYDLLSPAKKKEWMNKVRYALKYLPATTGVTVGLNLNRD